MRHAIVARRLEDVQQLALVLVDALDLGVEHRRAGHRHAQLRLHVPREPPLVLQLALAPALLEAGVLGELADGGDELQVAEEVLVDRLAQQLRQRGVAQR